MVRSFRTSEPSGGPRNFSATKRHLALEMKADKNNPFIDPGDVSFKSINDKAVDQHAREVADLAAAIRYHDHCYYVLNDPRLADGTYDALFRRLQALEETFPELQSGESPTQRVGGAVQSEFPEIEHQAPMQSLDSGGEEADVREFDLSLIHI